MKAFETLSCVFAVYMGVGVLHHLYRRYVVKSTTQETYNVSHR